MAGFWLRWPFGKDDPAAAPPVAAQAIVSGTTVSHTERLVGLHPDLVRVVKRYAMLPGAPPVGIAEGLRSAEREAQMVAEGKSQTTNSRHLTGHAVDLVALRPDGGPDWSPAAYAAIWAQMQLAGKAERVPLEWGGDWHSFKDYDHFQLPWKEYPA